MARAVIQLITMLLIGCTVGACSDRANPSEGASQPAPPLTTLPAEVVVAQRSTTEIPGSGGQLLLTIDDITRGQVMLSLADRTGTSVLPARSMSVGDRAPFVFERGRYEVSVTKLDNALVGPDHATVVISQSTSEALTEDAKIERLILGIAELENATFIRNGGEHTAREAADHLRSKWQSGKGQIQTAEQFIEGIASKSSLSGTPYEIRFADGRTQPSGVYLRERLRALESGR